MATRKTATKKVSAPKKTSTVEETKTTTPASRIKVKNLILPVIVIAIIAALWLLRGQLIAATVNGQPISRLEIISDLEKKQGKNALENMITEKLILQEAENRKITASDAEINKEISTIKKSIESQGQSFNDILAAQGMTENDLNKQIKFQVLLKKMVGTTTVSEKEIDEYMEQNKEMLPEGTDEATLRPQIKQTLEQQKADGSIQKLIQDLRTKAKIDYLIKY